MENVNKVDNKKVDFCGLDGMLQEEVYSHTGSDFSFRLLFDGFDRPGFIVLPDETSYGGLFVVLPDESTARFD